MKKILFTTLLIAISVAAFAQSRNNSICRIGFSYEISQSPNWGLGQPIIKNIIPYSSAELSGLKQGDIIEAIDNVPVSSVTLLEIQELLNPIDKNEVILTVRTISSPDTKQVRVKKECKKSNTITEDQLASAFNMYSLETTSEREFVCPFKTTSTADPVDFCRFQTFAFSPFESGNERLEIAINNYIRKELTSKGMVEEVGANPDIRVETFYFFDKNPNFRGANKLLTEKEMIYRYDLSHSRMEQLPFLNPLSSESEAEYLLQLGIRLVDQRDIPGRVLWECESNELLDGSYRLDDYARIHIPLMCMQYPYVKYTRNVPYLVSRKSYNYTGIQYDIDRMELVADIDRNSPAYAAGVRTGDIIERIGRHKMDKTTEEYTAAYKRFITNTMKFRDQQTQFTDANGFRFCMLWDTFKYTQIASAMQQAGNLAAFSYLYYFTPYVNPSGNNACEFHIRRGKEKSNITIRPTIRTEMTIEIN